MILSFIINYYRRIVSMKKYKIQSKPKDKIFKTNFSENLKGMSLIEALIIFTLRHSYGVIKKNLKPINYNENQNSKILFKIADNATKISECLTIGSVIDITILHPKSQHLSLDELKILKLAFLIQNEKYFAAIYEAENWIRPTTARIMCEALGKLMVAAQLEGMSIPYRDFYETTIDRNMLN